MRPLIHPNPEEFTVEGILHALSDPIRLQIVSELANASCGQRCASFLSLQEGQIAKSTLSQHLRVLREAGLIRSKRNGVELLNTLRCGEVRDRFGNLLESVLNAFSVQQGKQTNR